MMPPPKSKNSASGISSTSLTSGNISSETNSSGTVLSTAASDKQRVQHPAIVVGGVGRDNQMQPQPLHTTTDLLANKRDQQILDRATISKSRQILINPNTGMLESGPSESSSEGENDLESTIASAVATSDKRKNRGPSKAETNTVEGDGGVRCHPDAR